MLEEGDGVVELGMGFPNVIPTVIDPAGFIHTGFDVFENDNKSFGQVVLKAEYFMSDRIGIAGSLCYGFFATHDVAENNVWDGNTQTWTTQNYFYDSKIHKLRFTLGINIHALRTHRVDSYFGFQAGGKDAWLKYKTNDPNVTGDAEIFVFPFAMRVHYGFRIFFNEFLAANMELGLGGPLINAGLTYKF